MSQLPDYLEPISCRIKSSQEQNINLIRQYHRPLTSYIKTQSESVKVKFFSRKIVKIIVLGINKGLNTQNTL